MLVARRSLLAGHGSDVCKPQALRRLAQQQHVPFACGDSVDGSDYGAGGAVATLGSRHVHTPPKAGHMRKRAEQTSSNDLEAMAASSTAEMCMHCERWSTCTTVRSLPPRGLTAQSYPIKVRRAHPLMAGVRCVSQPFVEDELLLHRTRTSGVCYGAVDVRSTA